MQKMNAHSKYNRLISPFYKGKHFLLLKEKKMETLRVVPLPCTHTYSNT